ncbi:acireductone synthase [Pseudomonas sp. Marseille-Q5115]|uniref:acireductone synthase n=1 Tax=Pseudomonas sp. Marseille-Q5115 TaxID=2866593 RepID=UPI001CE4B4CA|nr:acireductone synthase [Pseudomonas sp. Marseille-Q5115]
MPIKAILTDIEGTTSAVSFVYDVLFPFAASRLPGFLREHQAAPTVAAQIEAVRAEAGEPSADLDQVIEILLGWMREDRKVTPLKALQGQIWQKGYESGELKGHVYPDAVAALKQWHAKGYRLYVYSSGSIQAQKLIFGCSEAGDLTGLFSGYFDTTSGGKRDGESYRVIASAIDVAPQQVLFLSDVTAELDAAREAGMATCGLAREGELEADHPVVASFDRIDVAAY